MKKTIGRFKYLLPFLVLLFVSCTSFEIVTEIKPKVIVVGSDVGFVYDLGNLKISQTVKSVRKAKREYIEANKDKAIFTVRIYKADGNYPTIRYFIDGMLIKDPVSSPVTDELLIANMDSINGFYLYKINGEEAIKENKELIKQEIQKVKEKVKEEDRYKQIENKW